MSIIVFAKKNFYQRTPRIRILSIFLLLFSLLFFNTLTYNTPIANADEVLDTVPVGGSPIGLTFNDFNKNMYIANADSNTVSVIDSDSNQVIATIPVGDLTVTAFDSPMEFNPFNNKTYVANDGFVSFQLLNSHVHTVTKTIPVQIPF